MGKRCNREQALITYGDNHAKEAKALSLIRDAVSADARVQLVKTAEGARADCCLFRSQAPEQSMGVQVKTSGVRQIAQREFYSFNHTNGYTGMLMIFVAFDSVTRYYVMPGALITSKTTDIPAVPKFARRFDWQRYEVGVASLMDTLVDCFDLPDITLKPMEDFMCPGHHTDVWSTTRSFAYSRLCSCHL